MKRVALTLCALLCAAVALAQEDAPATCEALLSAAHEHMRAGRTDQADEALRRAIKAARTDEERAAAIFTLAALRESRADAAAGGRAALEVLTQALQLEGGGEWVSRCLQRLGYHADRLRDVETARAAWERLLELVPEDSADAATALRALARIERQAGRPDLAVAHLGALLAREAHAAWHREARENLTTLLVEQGEYERALATAREIDDESRRPRLMLEVADRLLDANEAARAEEVAREVLAHEPGQMTAMRLAYRAALQRNALDDLRRELQQEATGDTPEAALAFLAEIARWEDDPPAAIGYLRRLAQLRPDDPDVRVRLGGAALDAERLDEAETALRDALRLAPEHGGALTSLAELLVRRGRTDEAIEQLKRAVGYDPADAGSVRSLDHALRRHALHHARVQAIEEARAASGDEAIMAYELAQAYVDLLRYEEATREFLRALADEGVPARAVGMELERLVVDEIAGPGVLAAVRAHLRESAAPTNAERLALARVLLAAGDREGAGELLAGLEGAGAAVADLGREVDLRGDDELAASLYAMALAMDLPEFERADIALSLARLQRDRGAWALALETLEATPSLDAHPEALLMRARLLTDHARRLDDAREAWSRLLDSAGAEPRYAAAARQGMADWLFATGRYDDAERAYAELAGEQPAGDGGFAAPWDEPPPLPPGLLPHGGLPLAIPTDVAGDPAWAALRLAEIALRRGDREEAEARLRFVATQYVQTPRANDALERLAFIRDNLGGRGSAEARYFEALGLRERGEHRVARDLLLEIAGTRDEPLADDALVMMGELRLEQGDSRAAAETWLSVAERFPDSMLAPGALLRAAELLRGELADPAGAAGALHVVIDRYPDSAAAHQARAELELLPRSGS